MEKNISIARIAGILYLTVIISGFYSLGYVPAKTIIVEDTAQSLTLIFQNEHLYRAGLAASMICYTAFTFLVMALYALFKNNYSYLAKSFSILALLSIPVSFLNLQNKYTLLTLAEQYHNSIPTQSAAIENSAMLLIQNYSSGVMITGVFWGLWLFPLGLILKQEDKIIQKTIGWLLILGSIGYIIDFVCYTLFPSYPETIISSLINLPASFGEIGVCLWLLSSFITRRKT